MSSTADQSMVLLPTSELTHPALPGVRVTIEEVAPEQAQEWLDIGAEAGNNRKLRDERAESFAEDMGSNWWFFNGETLKFDRNGVPVDGQHRMRAIVLSGKPQYMLIVRGLDSETIHTIDMGVARRYADVLKMRGLAKDNLVAAASMERRLFMWKRRGRKCRVSRGRAAAGLPTPSELLAFHEEYQPLLQLALARGLDLRKTLRKVAPATLATAYFLFAEIDANAAGKFFDQLVTGLGFNDVRHPVKVLRDRLLGESQLAARRTTEDEKLALICRAWNHFRAGSPVATLYITLQGKPLNDETFPEPR